MNKNIKKIKKNIIENQLQENENRNEIINSIKNIILKYEKYIKEAYIFGSYARGDFNKYSDIDIAIYCEDYDIYFNVCEEIENINTIRKIDIHNLAYCHFYFDMKEVKNKNAIKLY